MKPIAPPFPNDDAFYCRFFTEIGSYTDSANRRLHEVDFRAEEGEQAFKRCPFHDSRKDYLMNNAALKQITSEWADIKEGVGFFTSLFEVENEDELDLARAWRISLSTMFSPLYLFKRVEKPFENGNLPTSVSGVFKIMLDVPTTIDLMMMKGSKDNIGASTGKDVPVSIRTFADNSLILLNGDYACAGSPGLMDDINGIMFENRKYDENSESKWSSYFPDAKQFQSFNHNMTAQYAMGIMYLMSTAIAMETAYKGLQSVDGMDFSSLSPEREEKLSAYERRRRFMLSMVQDPNEREPVFRQFYDLASDSKKWGLQSGKHQGLGECLDLSVDFLSRTDKAKPEEISVLHDAYSENIRKVVLQSHKTIEFIIGSKGMFSEDVEFGQLPDRNPANILRTILQTRAANPA